VRRRRIRMYTNNTANRASKPLPPSLSPSLSPIFQMIIATSKCQSVCVTWKFKLFERYEHDDDDDNCSHNAQCSLSIPTDNSCSKNITEIATYIGYRVNKIAKGDERSESLLARTRVSLRAARRDRIPFIIIISFARRKINARPRHARCFLPWIPNADVADPRVKCIARIVKSLYESSYEIAVVVANGCDIRTFGHSDMRIEEWTKVPLLLRRKLLEKRRVIRRRSSFGSG